MVASQAERDWWRQAVVYQIYPRSFCDANGDGIGDLKGITAKVPYLKELGVDAIWLSPFYPSPLKDGGYDVTDYRDVDPRIGNLDDFDEMSRALKAAGIRTIVDIVPNHSSNEHVMFLEAVKAGKGSPQREWYHFRDGKGPNKDQPPNDWHSLFGGSAWSPSGANDGQFYLHMFDASQPDWNWKHPDVHAEFINTLRFWADRGVSGFRIDVAHACVKNMDEPLPTWDEMEEMRVKMNNNQWEGLDHPLHDRDEVQDIYREWRKVFNEYDPPLTAVAECWVAPERKKLYASPEGLGQAFSFDILLCNFNAAEYKKCIDLALKDAKEARSSTTWVFSNHDVMRHATRYGLADVDPTDIEDFQRKVMKWLRDGGKPAADIETGLRRARAATLMSLALPGSNYLYQGEELGLQEVHEIPAEDRADPQFFRTNGHMVGRDGCRVPIPWSATEKNFGNGSGKRPHLPQPDWFKDYAADVEDKDANSTLNMYRKALHLRRDLQAAEDLTWHAAEQGDDEGVLRFERPGGWGVIFNGNKKEAVLPKGVEVLISSGAAVSGDKVPAETTVWYRK